jgi:hypothetical protein
MISPLIPLVHNGYSRACHPHKHTPSLSLRVFRPFPYPGHVHIPFSLEETCSSIALVPQEERVDEAVILGKLFRRSDASSHPTMLIALRSQTSSSPKRLAVSRLRPRSGKNSRSAPVSSR